MTTAIPYRWSEGGPSILEFSLSICLVRVLIMMLNITVIYLTCSTVWVMAEGNVGGVAFITIVYLQCGIGIVSLFKVIHSKEVATLIIDILEALKNAKDLVKDKSYSFLNIVFITISTVFVTVGFVATNQMDIELNPLIKVFLGIPILLPFIEGLISVLLLKCICYEISRLLLSGVINITNCVEEIMLKRSVMDTEGLGYRHEIAEREREEVAEELLNLEHLFQKVILFFRFIGEIYMA